MPPPHVQARSKHYDQNLRHHSQQRGDYQNHLPNGPSGRVVTAPRFGPPQPADERPRARGFDPDVEPLPPVKAREAFRKGAPAVALSFCLIC